jgi:hypothetical protein
VHHSLNNNLWDRERRLLRISNQKAAREFTSILLQGIEKDLGANNRNKRKEK